jgi:hypothetical protein
MRRGQLDRCIFPAARSNAFSFTITKTYGGFDYIPTRHKFLTMKRLERGGKYVHVQLKDQKVTEHSTDLRQAS